MQRVTVTLDDELVQALDRMVDQKGYQNRSEALRDLARSGLREMEVAAPEAKDCVGALVYVYDHAARELSKRLIRSFHDHHDLSLATMHIHLDHDSCMEVTVLRGETQEVQRVAEHVIAERGVRHGRLMLIPVEVETREHGHGGHGIHAHDHIVVK